MKPNKPSNKYFMKALIKKVDSKSPKKAGIPHRSKRMLMMPNPKGGPDIFVTPAMYRNLHLGKKKASKKNG